MIKEYTLDNLIEIRKDNNLTQKQIASILKTSRANYTRWETKANIIPLNRLNELCNYFNINMDYILGLSNEKKKMSNNNIINKKLIGQNFKKIRIKNNISQIELAKILNTTHSVISAYENGENLILMAFAYQICQKYNLSLDELCNRK